MSKLQETIISVTSTNPYENLPIIAGKCGQNVFKLVAEAEKADKELDILHECIMDLYNLDAALPTIKKYLDKIDKLKP